MRYLGDFIPGAVIRLGFNTCQSDGTPITLAGTPVVSVYKDASTVESTAGVTLTVDFDARTGLHQLAIDTSVDGTFYSSGSDYRVVITTGTVNAISVVGTVVASFSLANRSALRPTTAGRTLSIDTSGNVTLGAYASGQDPATLMAAAGYNSTRAGRLDNLDATVSSRAATADTRFANLDATVSSRAATADTRFANLDVAVSTRSTYAGADTTGTTTLLSRLTSTRAGLLDNLDAAITTRVSTADSRLANLDAAVSTRLASSAYTAPDNTSITTIAAQVDAIHDGYLAGTSSATVAATDGTTTQFTVSGLSQAKSYVGMQVEFSTGANAKTRRAISAQTNAGGNVRLTVATAFAVAPSSGDTADVF